MRPNPKYRRSLMSPRRAKQLGVSAGTLSCSYAKRLYQAALRYDGVTEAGAFLDSRWTVFSAAILMVSGREQDNYELKLIAVGGNIDLNESAKIIEEHLGAYAVDRFWWAVRFARWLAAENRL